MPVAAPGDGSIWERVVGSESWLLRDVRTGKVWAVANKERRDWWGFMWEAFGVQRTGMRFDCDGRQGLFGEIEGALVKAGAPILYPIRRPRK